MKSRIFPLLVATCLSCASAQAEEFYVELGRTGSDSDAKAMWEEIKGQHAFLTEYDVFPNQILQTDGTFTFRVQAGPMLDKREAQRVCNRLFRRKVSCFVIEGFDPKNAPTFSDTNKSLPVPLVKQDFALPWLASAPVVAPPPEVAEAPPRADINAKAKVDVAEAIPVPVTAGDTQVTVGDAFEVADASGQPSIEMAPEALKQPGWVSVQPFLDEQRARSYWSELRGKLPRAQRGLEVRVIHPVVSHDIPKVILSLGTFESESDAVAFCKEYVPSSTYLECRFSSQPPEGEEPAASPESLPVSARDVPGSEYSLYWVEVLSEASQDKALEKWERIRTDNDDLLADVRSQITTSFSSPGRYAVRIGPIKSKTKAGTLCDALKARRLTCKLTTL